MTALSTRPFGLPPWRCSSSERSVSVPDSRSTGATSKPQPTWCVGWMGFRSRSSWSLLGRTFSSPDRCWSGSNGAPGVPMSAGRDFPERQRTLRATLEWSHNLLTPPQRTLLARLGMFADGATLEAIESVCSGAPVLDLLDSLSALLDNGLIRVDRQRREGQPRFVLLLTVREFALERLAAPTTLSGCHRSVHRVGARDRGPRLIRCSTGTRRTDGPSSRSRHATSNWPRSC